jgi:hypothetical protein
MDMLYDTRTIHPFDRYDHYRAGAGMELVPVAVQGRAPGRLLAVMSVAQIGDFEIEVLTWSADSEIVTRRTERLIRACDPECYRILLSVSGEIRVEQAGNQADVRARDIVLYDVSRPCQATHSTGPGLMRLVMLTFPRALVPIASTRVRPLIGTLIPRSMPGRSLIAQFLIGLTDTTELTGDPDLADPDLAHVLYECTVGLLRQRLANPTGSPPAPVDCCTGHAFATLSVDTSITPCWTRTGSPKPHTSRHAIYTSYSRTPNSPRCNCSNSYACMNATVACKIRRWP